MLDITLKPLDIIRIIMNVIVQWIDGWHMLTRVLSYHPLIHLSHKHGLAMGHIEAYATKCSDLVKWINELHMFTRGHAKHPCTQSAYSLGFAVGRVERYPCRRVDCTQGCLA